MGVNLLPVSMRRQLLVRRLIMRWSAPWLVCGAAMTAFCGWRYSQLMEQREILAAIEQQCRPVQEVVAQSREIEAGLQAAVARYAELEQAPPADSALAMLAIVSQATRKTSGRMQIEQTTFEEARLPAAGPAGAVASERGAVIVRGVAVDDEAVASFVDALRSTNAVHSIEMKSSSHHTIGESDGRRFEMVCRF